ncbi:MAG: SdrD B-like domain-containing protein, partial [Intestinibacter sp.]
VIIDNDQSLKENYAEINGYENYYAEGEKLPNKQTIKNNKTPAGIIDNNSTPGNLSLDDLEGEKYEKNFEDDTDRAKSIKVYLEQSAIRKINGTAWEDERTQSISKSVLGDGIRQKDEIGIAGVTVELVEIMKDGKEYVWQTTTTNEKGYYEFSDFIPGNYVVRFQYGNNQETVLTANNGGKNAVSYNGQDFKSTVYQQDLKNNQSIANYTDEYYNIQKADELSANGKTDLSDAKDLWENQTINTGRTQNSKTNYQNETYQGRTNVNAYSTSNVNNHKAEVLASPYMASIDNSLVQELMQNTHMTAQTAIIVIEGEYNRTNTDGLNSQSNGTDKYLYNNDKNGNYALNCVDFGLTERPKAQLT